MLKICKRLKSQAGFTLIELIIVVVILATLAGLALLNTGGTENDAKYSKSKADVDTICTALKVYKMKTNAYPVAYNSSNPTTTGLALLTNDNGKYKAMLDSVPLDPFSSSGSAIYNYAVTSSTATVSNAGSGDYSISVTLK